MEQAAALLAARGITPLVLPRSQKAVLYTTSPTHPYHLERHPWELSECYDLLSRELCPPHDANELRALVHGIARHTRPNGLLIAIDGGFLHMTKSSGPQGPQGPPTVQPMTTAAAELRLPLRDRFTLLYLPGPYPPPTPTDALSAFLDSRFGDGDGGAKRDYILGRVIAPVLAIALFGRAPAPPTQCATLFVGGAAARVVYNVVLRLIGPWAQLVTRDSHSYYHRVIQRRNVPAVPCAVSGLASEYAGKTRGRDHVPRVAALFLDASEYRPTHAVGLAIKHLGSPHSGAPLIAVSDPPPVTDAPAGPRGTDPRRIGDQTSRVVIPDLPVAEAAAVEARVCADLPHVIASVFAAQDRERVRVGGGGSRSPFPVGPLFP